MSSSTVIGAADVIRSASEVADLVRERADQSQQLGTMPPEIVQALRESRLPWICFPEDMGGLGVTDVTTLLEVTEMLARADGSAGWTYMIAATAAMMTAFYSGDELYADLFSGPELPLFAGSGPMPGGTATPVEGGWIASGHWSFCSGSAHSDWLMGYVRLEAGEEPPDQATAPILVLFPTRTVEFQGNWDVMGMRGTGSYDWSVKDAFIPAHRTFDQSGPDQRGGPVARLGMGVFGAGPHVAVSVGIAARALEEIARYAPTKTRLRHTVPLADTELFQAGFAQQEASFQAMRTLLYGTYAAAQRRVDAGGTLNDACFQRLSQVNHYTQHVSEEVVKFCFGWAGASAARNNSVLGRCVRDILVASQHIIVDRHNMVTAAPSLLQQWRQGSHLPETFPSSPTE